MTCFKIVGADTIPLRKVNRRQKLWTKYKLLLRNYDNCELFYFNHVETLYNKEIGCRQVSQVTCLLVRQETGNSSGSLDQYSQVG